MCVSRRLRALKRRSIFFFKEPFQRDRLTVTQLLRSGRIPADNYGRPDVATTSLAPRPSPVTHTHSCFLLTFSEQICAPPQVKRHARPIVLRRVQSKLTHQLSLYVEWVALSFHSVFVSVFVNEIKCARNSDVDLFECDISEYSHSSTCCSI